VSSSLENRVTVLLPAFNEARALPGVIRAAIEHTPGLLEVLVVDDGSTDGTKEASERAGARVVRLERNRGKGEALRCGLGHARGDVLVFMDADGQDDPRDTPALLAALVPGVDLVVGSRFLGRFEPGAITPVNYLGNRFLTEVANALFGTRLTDTQAGFKALRRSTIETLSLRASRFDIEVDVLLGVVRRGGVVREVPVRRSARAHGRSRLDSVRDGTRILLRMLALRAGR
jgi:glycosyltransferase involved in cell wall biosynthesis